MMGLVRLVQMSTAYKLMLEHEYSSGIDLLIRP